MSWRNCPVCRGKKILTSVTRNDDDAILHDSTEYCTACNGSGIEPAPTLRQPQFGLRKQAETRRRAQVHNQRDLSWEIEMNRGR